AWLKPGRAWPAPAAGRRRSRGAETMLAHVRSMWSSAEEADEEALPVVSLKLRLRFVVLLVIQAMLLAVRWHLGDAHGSLLMLAVLAIGVLAITARMGEVDSIYSGYFALMAMVCGLLDANLAIEKLLWIEWHYGHWDRKDIESVAKPAFYLTCAATQFA
ncbi:unnamed protein product, partial [Effrenium voratum]